jgi:hypothetical protein
MVLFTVVLIYFTNWVEKSYYSSYSIWNPENDPYENDFRLHSLTWTTQLILRDQLLYSWSLRSYFGSIARFSARLPGSAIVTPANYICCLRSHFPDQHLRYFAIHLLISLNLFLKTPTNS